MKLRMLIAALAVASTGLVAAPTATYAATGSDASVTARACTRTSSGSCIRGGQFCPQSKFGKSGWDSQGRRYVCKGSRTHPHWMIP